MGGDREPHHQTLTGGGPKMAEPARLNVPLLRKVMDHIRNLPDMWGKAATDVTAPQDYWAQDRWLQGLSESGILEVVRITGQGTRSRLAGGGEDDWHPCKTAACFAGWAVILGAPDGIIYNPYSEHVIPPGSAPSSFRLYAQQLLGLTTIQAGRLFTAGNTLTDLEGLVSEFTGEGDE
jgi:hypothetical protein